MSRKALKIFTATTVAASVVTPVASASTTFNDITPTNSHFEAVQALVERGVINGYEDGTFRPNATLTRGQAAKILANALNLDTSSTTQKFSDVTPKSGYIGAINALAQVGIINGYEDNTFKPNAPLTRGQMAKILVNAFKLEKASELKHSFKDVSAANGYNYDIQTLVNYEITQGTTTATYAPTESVKRGQMATFVVRAEKAVKQQTAVLHVTAVKGNTLVTEQGEFEVAENLAALLSEKNAKALQNATIKATVKDNKIEAIETLQLTAGGTKEAPIVLDGQKSTFEGSLIVAGDFVELKDLTVAQNVTVGGAQQSSVKLSGVTVNGVFKTALDLDKVASLAPVANTELASTYQFDNTNVAAVEIARNNVTINTTGSSELGTVSLSATVKQIELVGVFKEVILPASSEVKVTGNATIAKLVVNAAKAILDLVGSIASVEALDAKSQLTLNTALKISKLIVATGADVAKIITNYNAVRANIGTVDGGTASNSNNNSSDWATVSSPNGGTVVTPTNPTNPTEQTPEIPKLPDTPLDSGNEQLKDPKPVAPTGTELVATISQIVVTTGDSANIPTGDSAVVTSADTVKVKLSDGQTYSVATDLAGFFKWQAIALSGARVTLIVNNGRIEAIQNLELVEVTAPVTTIDGGGITIHGNVKVSNQITSLSNLIITGNVILAADRTQDIEVARATVFGKVEFETAKALAMRSMFAGMTQVAAATTRIKITFTDSTVAIIEVRKDDVELHTGGTSEISNIRLFANTDITSSLTNGKILPKIVIGKGVTSVNLNASIANVVIESDENVIVGGEGNFDNVVINTSKEVAINTVGTIGNLDIKKEDPKVTLGEEVQAVQTVTTILPVSEVFQNYEELKGKVGQVILPNVDFFAAELIGDNKEIGYFTIKLAGVGNYAVKYRLIDYEGRWNLPEIVRNVDKVPADALTYKVGEKIFVPANKVLFVYTVDETGIIKDYKNDFSYGDSIRFTATESGTKIESTFDVADGSKVADVYNAIFNFELEKPVIYLGATTIQGYNWTKEGNLVSFIVPGTDRFTLAEEDKGQSHFHFDWNDRKARGHGYGGSFGAEKATALKVIKEIFTRSINDPAPSAMLSGAINLAFYAELDIREDVVGRSNAEQYRSAVKQAKTLEELYDLIVKVNGTKK